LLLRRKIKAGQYEVSSGTNFSRRGSAPDGLIDFDFWCFNATFSNISAISWRPVLVVEEAGVQANLWLTY
jgi:hypothetical protein